jgi:alpha-2-macroglobulin
MPELIHSRRKLINRLAVVLPILLILISLACSKPILRPPATSPTSAAPTLTSPPPSPTPTRRALPPALVESTPPPGSEIPLNSLITLFFNQPMNRSSVEAALKAQAFLISDLVWTDDSTLTINPGQALPPGASLGVQLDTQARAANGLALSEPISLTYQTVGFLDLTQRLPEPEAQDVNPTSAVVAAFDYPVVPLGADPASLPNPLKLDPPAEGRGEWINTSTYIFYPEPALAGGKTYNVQVDSTLHGIDGNPLMSQPTWSFTTAKPRLEVASPTSADRPMGLDASLSFIFNQPMNPDSVQANFQVLDPDGSPVPGQFNWDETHTEFDWKPSNLLLRDTRYRVSLDGQAQALGGTPLDQGYQDSLQTIPELRVLSSTPVQGGKLNQYYSIVIEFSGPLQPSVPKNLLTFQPSAAGVESYSNASDRTLSIYGFFDPATDYTLTISPELSDPWGSKLGGESGQPYTLHFLTSPLEPGVVVGNGTTDQFLTTQDRALTAQISGIRSLPVSLGPLPLDDFLKMQRSDNYQFQRDYRLTDPHKWNQAISTDPNRTQQTEIYLSPSQSALPPGLYFMRLAIPGQQDEQTRRIVVSDTHMAVKIGATDALVWAVDLTSGQPVANTPVTIYDGDRQLASGQTDDQGIFTATFPARSDVYSTGVAVIGQPGDKNFSVGLSDWSAEIAPWSFNLPTETSGPRQQVYLYTDRPIYRPGQPVNFRGVLREAYNGRYTIPSRDTLTIQLTDDNGQIIDSQELPLSSYGTLHGQFNLPANLRPATYSMIIPDLAYLTVPVADYRKPEINLKVTFPQTDLLAGQNLQATVSARYFFDAPAGNVHLDWNLYSYPADFDLPGYQTGLQGVGQWYTRSGSSYGKMIDSGTATTLPDGTAQIDLGAIQFDPARQRYELEVTANDESGLPVSARQSVFVNPAEYYIGLRSDAWSGRAGEPSGFDVQAARWDDSSAGELTLRAEFSSVAWEPDENAVNPVWGTPLYKPMYTLVASTDFRTGTDGQARLEFTPPDPGIYQLNVFSLPANSEPRTASSQNLVARTEIVQWVGGPGQFVLPETDDRHIQLDLDRESYKPGETAHLFIPNPFPAAVQALVTVERGIILEHQILSLEPGGTTLDLLLTADDAPNVYISVTLLAVPSSPITNPEAPITMPDFRQGYINLPVEPVEQSLNVQITRNPEKTGPGGKVDFEIKVTDSAGAPVQGEFSLAVVDLAALALADPNLLEIIPNYYGQQPLNVRTGIPLTSYAVRRFKNNLPGTGGGGGGDGVIPQVREKFPDTAFWQADIVTDSAGKAHVSMQLPDSLTTWQVEARGLTSDTRVGQAQAQVVTTKDLLIRPITPRFLVAGDHVELAAIVQNNSAQTVIGEAALQADGVLLDDPTTASQPVSIEPGGRQRLTWWGTAGDQPTADLVFSVTSQDGTLQDASRPALGKLPVLRYNAPQTFRTAGTLDEAGQRLELVSLPRWTNSSASVDPRGGPQGGSLDLELSPSLAAAMIGALDVLEKTDCLCNELTLSRLLANLEAYRTLQQFNLLSPGLQASLQRSAAEDLQAIINRQYSDGGWSWWPVNITPYSGESHSDPFLTSYVLFGLTQARDAGLLTDNQPIQRAVDYLNNNLSFDKLPTTTGELDRLAFAQFALAGAENGSLDHMQTLYQERAKLSSWSQALLALALERLSPGSQEADTLLSDLEAGAVRSAAGAHWELKSPQDANMTSTLTNSAIVTYALAKRNPTAPLVSDAARFLIDNRQPDGAWTSTYTTAWTLLALNEVMKATQELGGNFSFSASLNDTPVANGQASGPDPSMATLTPVSTSLPLNQLYPDSPNLLAIEHGVGPGRLYYSAILNVSRPAEQVKPLSQGMSLTREYFPAVLDCAKENCTPIQSAQPNEKVTVRLTLNVPNDAYYLRVEDFIPAGAEILDTRLKTSQQNQGGGPAESLQYDPANPFANGWGWWYFHEASIYDDHIAWSADYLPKGTYELTYTFVPLQAGEFQVLPAHAWEFYFPEVQATSSGGKFTIK